MMGINWKRASIGAALAAALAVTGYASKSVFESIDMQKQDQQTAKAAVAENTEDQPETTASLQNEAAAVLKSRSGMEMRQPAPQATETPQVHAQATATVPSAPHAVNRQTASTPTASASQVINMVATAYGPPNVNWKFGGKTYSGTPVRQGIIAVDPNVIPLGTMVWVTGCKDPNLPASGFMAVAEDIGGAIQGNRIDIYINTNNLQSLRDFGMQNVQVKILK